MIDIMGISMSSKISVIIPFYKGNNYIERALKSVETVYQKIRSDSDIEVLIVNDSPGVEIFLPDTFLDVKVITNNRNCGIQYSRIVGLKIARGEFIQFLDQDDELIPDGYDRQIELLHYSDVVVGNGEYNLGKKCFTIYKSQSSMEYLIQLRRMIEIRNLIPSPGECLLRKEAIPDEWINSVLQNQGADDWMLWIIFLKQEVQLGFNPLKVYRHNDTKGSNYSADLYKMKLSALEANWKLRTLGVISEHESESWKRAIEFKYLQDTGRLGIRDVVLYRQEIVNNIIYKIRSSCFCC